MLQDSFKGVVDLPKGSRRGPRRSSCGGTKKAVHEIEEALFSANTEDEARQALLSAGKS